MRINVDKAFSCFTSYYRKYIGLFKNHQFASFYIPYLTDFNAIIPGMLYLLQVTD